MSSTTTFQPRWLSAPGETIVDLLRQRNVSDTDFASQIGRTDDQVRQLLNGTAPVTTELADKLENVVGGSAEFWRSRERQFRQDLALLTDTEGNEWIAELPLTEMMRFGWIAKTSDAPNQLLQCMNFFRVNEIQTWREKYTDVLTGRAFKTSPAINSRPAAVAAWLRQAEIKAERIVCQSWDAALFRRKLSEMRSLTRQRRPYIFLPEATRLCAESGVALVILRAPQGCRASGATWFLSAAKAVIVLSFRYLSDDHFWFTLFHEAGHLLLHEHTALFLEGVDRICTVEEEEANAFAAATLIPPSAEQEFVQLPLDGRKVMRFARKIGIAPGIVVGQLQHRGLITQRQLNSLKTRFQWDVD